MIEIERPNITTVELKSDGSYGKFVIEPLERGYGTTLGNSLRRVLLSSLPGVAATSVKIDGVLHEISVIPNVKEDVPEIILNIKGITAKLHTDSPKTVILEAPEEGEVKAGDIKCDADIENSQQGPSFGICGGRRSFENGAYLRTWPRLCFG